MREAIIQGAKIGAVVGVISFAVQFIVSVLFPVLYIPPVDVAIISPFQMHLSLWLLIAYILGELLVGIFAGSVLGLCFGFILFRLDIAEAKYIFICALICALISILPNAREFIDFADHGFTIKFWYMSIGLPPTRILHVLIFDCFNVVVNVLMGGFISRLLYPRIKHPL